MGVVLLSNVRTKATEIDREEGDKAKSNGRRAARRH
jgi:hypothetical protein